jgi:hypothetical protein
MTEHTKIFTIAHVPPELERAWLQHLRDFDVAHPDCHFQVMVDGPPDATFEEIMEKIRIEPGLTFTEMFKRKLE